MARTLDKIKNTAKTTAKVAALVTMIGILPHVIRYNCQNLFYVRATGQPEYGECAAFRTVKVRKAALQAQEEINDYLIKQAKEIFNR